MVRPGQLVCALVLAGCSSTPSQQSASLSASSDAHRFGVDHYVSAGEAMRLFDADGAELGQITISQPTAETRVVDVKLADGTGVENEITRPLDGRFQVRLPADSLSAAVMVDPVLASFFAARQIDAAARDAATPVRQLKASDYATCLHATPTSGCYDLTSYPQYYCQYYESWEYNYYGGDYVDDCQTNCVNWYPGMGLNGYVEYYTCYCRGGSFYTDYYNDISCPRVSCGTSGQRDLVERRRSCTEPGSCVNSSLYQSCTTL